MVEVRGTWIVKWFHVSCATMFACETVCSVAVVQGHKIFNNLRTNVFQLVLMYKLLLGHWAMV